MSIEKDKFDVWKQSREKVISDCPYFKEIKPRIDAVKALQIPPILKFFINEAIADFVFGMYPSTIILCRAASEIALKFYAIEKYLEQFHCETEISKSVINRISRSDLNDLQYLLEYSNLITENIKGIIGDIAKFGNIHVHGNFEKIVEEYLKSSITRESLLEYCLNQKKLDYILSPKGLMKSAMLDGYLLKVFGLFYVFLKLPPQLNLGC